MFLMVNAICVIRPRFGDTVRIQMAVHGFKNSLYRYKLRTTYGISGEIFWQFVSIPLKNNQATIKSSINFYHS